MWSTCFLLLAGADKRHQGTPLSPHAKLSPDASKATASMDEALADRGGMHAWMQKGVDFLDAKKTEKGVERIMVMQTDNLGQAFDWYRHPLLYKVLEEGKGVHFPMHDAECKVHYEGKLFTGEPIVNASTYGGEPRIITPITAAIEWDHPELYEDHHSDNTHAGEAHRRIEGFFEALTHMKEGDEWEIYMDPNMGWHINGVPQAGIPPASVTVFKLKLLEIMPGSTKTHIKPHPLYGAQHPTKDLKWKTRPENQGVNLHLHDEDEL